VTAVARERPDLGPAADDAHRWGTGGGELKIFCLVRTLVSAIRLAEILRVFDGDPRVKLVWVVCSGSRFEYGVLDWFNSNNISWISLRKAKQGSGDLVITTSEWIDVSSFYPTPVILVPHGLGFHKYVKDPDTNVRRLSGLARLEGLRRGHVTQVVTHPDQEDQLARVTREIIGRTTIGGDSSYDLLINSRADRTAPRRTTPRALPPGHLRPPGRLVVRGGEHPAVAAATHRLRRVDADRSRERLARHTPRQ
jgi:hypothetical protein